MNLHRLWSRLLLCFLLALPGLEAVAAPTLGGQTELRTRDQAANRILNMALADAFWQSSTKNNYSGHLYDEIRLRSYGGGFVSLVTGEGEEDFRPEVVADIVFRQQNEIPQHIEGAKDVVLLGEGIDPINGAPYTDTFFYLDMTLFYATYTQRMYRLEAGDGRTILYFEQLNESFVDASTWAQYQSTIQAASEAVEKRWVGNSVIPITKIYGMFIVSPGEVRQTRVTFINSLSFGEGTGMLAQMGSKMPAVIRAGLQSGFNACVAIASSEQKKRGQ
ncbi:MAG: hypothetical protein ACI8RZ_003379 [Myxococcota bacterium]|jgi:hypothetical protein